MVDKKQTINPAALWWRDCRADLSASLTASLSAFPPLGLWASVVKSLSAIPHSALRTLRIPPSANPLIIKPDPAQSCLIKPTSPSINPPIQ